MLRCKINRRGQIAETVTWFVATIIVIVTLVVFIFISTSLAKTKNASVSGVSVKVGDFLTYSGVGELSRAETKTLFAISMNEKNKEVINGWINEE
jgi:hypothetical protein